MKKDEVTNIIEFTGNTIEGDELLEWCDDEVPQHAVAVKREWRNLPDIAFHFATQDEAHTLFLALCQVQQVMVDGDCQLQQSDLPEEAGSQYWEERRNIERDWPIVY